MTTTKQIIELKAALLVLAALVSLAGAAQTGPAVVPVKGDASTYLYGVAAASRDDCLRRQAGESFRWTGSGQMTWKVQVDRAGDYDVALNHAAEPGAVGQHVQISSGSSRVEYTLAKTNGVFGDRSFEMAPIKGLLHLEAGAQSIAISIPDAPKTMGVLTFRSLVLTPVAAKAAIEADRQEALKARASTEWMAKAGYGLMFHYTSQSISKDGTHKPFAQAVDEFDVKRFADMVQETGAGYVIFTVCHAQPYCPAPLSSWEKYFPGKTTKRDLIAEMAQALNAKGIKLMCYFPAHVIGKYPRASSQEFTRMTTDIVKEFGERYGEKVAGYWFDGFYQCFEKYPDFSFREFFKICKAGNPNRVVALNSWIYPNVSEWQEYWAGETTNPVGLPVHGTTPERGPGGGLRYQSLLIMEPYWMQESVAMPRPQFTAQRLGDYVSQCKAKGGAVTINLGIYQEGTVDPRAVDVLKEVRKRIGGPSSSTPGPRTSAPGEMLTRQTQTDAPPATSLTLDPAKVNILMGLWSAHSPSITAAKIGGSGLHAKNFWLEGGWSAADQVVQWDVRAPKAEKYRLTFMMNAAKGTQVRATCGGSAILFAAPEDGWQRAEAEEPLSLAEGVNTIALRLSGNSSIRCFKSVELVSERLAEQLPAKIAALKGDTSWMKTAGYGIMVQCGGWAYPPHGAKKPWPGFAEDFDAAAFVQKVDEMGGKFIVWSDTLMLYQFPAPIAAISEVMPNAVSKRDLLGDVMKECKKREIRFITYYHMGHDHPQVLIDKGWDADWERHGHNRQAWFDREVKIFEEIGARYGKDLDGWFLDDGCSWYPADFQRLTTALKTGNPKRVVGYNPWIAPRHTEFQDYYCGEGFDGRRTPPGLRDGVPQQGPQKGLQLWGCFTFDGGWGIASPNVPIRGPGRDWTADRVVELTRRLEREKYSIAINLAMYEDGTISPDSYRLLVDAAKRLGRGPWKKQP
jgi:alpha-L-fucosidase